MRPVALLVVAAMLAACDSGAVVTSSCAGRPAPDDVRIVWGTGAEGVRFGDTEGEVRARLGEPDGLYYIDLAPSTHGLRWEEGPHAGFRATFFRRDDGPDTVGIVWLVEPFAGRTAEGVGIGSTRAEVECSFGEPDRRFGDGDVYVYESDSGYHDLAFEADTLRSLFMLRFVRPAP